MIKTAAYAAPAARAPLGPFSLERREPGPHDVLIDIAFCGICHSDIHQAREDWGPAIFPMVPGHEIVGTVARVGAAVTKFKAGDAVGVGCFVDSCRACEACEAGEEQYCHGGMAVTYNGYERDGKTPTYGGYSTHITVDENYVLRIPSGMPLDAAAPLLCAGITTYSPLRRHGVTKGTKVGIVGLGGLGHMGVKIARALGAHVTVLSHSPRKREDALRLGADAFVATSDHTVFETLAGTFDYLLDTVSAAHSYSDYLGLLRRDGTMTLVGLPEPTPINVFPLIIGRRRLTGSLIGGIRETQEMLDFCAAHNITADIERIPASKINEAWERTVASDVKYRFVIDCSTLR